MVNFRRLSRSGLLLSICLIGLQTRLTAAPEPPVIPRPMLVQPLEGRFTLGGETTIRFDGKSADLLPIARFLQEAINRQHSLALPTAEASSSHASSSGIRLKLTTQGADFNREGYELTVGGEGILLEAGTPTGLTWGVQTLLQLLAAESTGIAAPAKTVSLPAVRIIDRPRFAWRGLMLDCSRSFLTIDCLKKYVDVCAAYKMNVLHLHLTDDQGWRLEIRKHPRLTQTGARFDPCFPGEVDGYYTREQMRDLVRHADRHHVTIVPEIDIPGHCLALLATYPELSCREGADRYVIAPYLFQSERDPDKVPKTPHGVLCVGNERTFDLLTDVFDEVIDLFPGEYIHIGADECPKSFWKQCPKCQARMKTEGLQTEEQLQSYFVGRVANYLQSRGRKVFGWDEVLEGGLPPGLAVMGWRGMPLATEAVRRGYPVVMAQKSHLYLDFCYTRTPASLIYSFEPVPPELSLGQRPLVLGVEACMWTHLARTEPMIDMSIFPRLLALAEVGWTPADRRDWHDFAARMERHVPLLQARGVRTFERNEGAALPNLSAGQDGRVWLVNTAGEIFLRKDEAWQRFPGQARQVTSGPDGTIWSVGTQPARGGYALMQWSDRTWNPLGPEVAAVQIAAAADGSLWTASETYAIWRYAEEKWANVLGLAREVTAGPDGKVWIITGDPAPGGFQLYFAPPTGRWRRARPLAAGVRIAAGSADRLWLVRDDATVREHVGGTWHDRPGRVSQITVAMDGTAWALAERNEADVTILRWTGRNWQDMGPVPSQGE